LHNGDINDVGPRTLHCSNLLKSIKVYRDSSLMTLKESVVQYVQKKKSSAHWKTYAAVRFEWV